MICEHAIENGQEIDWSSLHAPALSTDEYAKAHQHLVICCHDVVIEYEGGFFLVVRDNVPAKDALWPIGGRLQKGRSALDSLRQKVKQECNLEISDITYLGTSRTLFATDPFNHNKGTDTLNLMYFARGKGKISLDHLHKKPTIVCKEDYTPILRNSLHPYVQEIMDLAWAHLAHLEKEKQKSDRQRTS